MHQVDEKSPLFGLTPAQMAKDEIEFLASVVGTAAALRPHDGAILMLEDVGEPYYRLERSLCQLLGNLTALESLHADRNQLTAAPSCSPKTATWTRPAPRSRER